MGKKIGYARISTEDQKLDMQVAEMKVAGSTDDPKVPMAKKMHADRSISIEDICSTLKISRATLYRYLLMKG